MSAAKSIKSSPLELNRHEIKIQIPISLVEPISNFVAQWCYLDAYSEMAADGFYTINSLYLDTPNMLFLENKRAKLVSRFNMRVRSYGDVPKAPYFFEVKEKDRGFVRKRRGVVHSEEWAQILADGRFPKGSDPENDSHLRRFVSLAWRYQVTPKLLTRYRRLAYISHVDKYARVTFDRDMGFQLEGSYNVKPDLTNIANYDVTDYFHPGCNVVLELKCERKVPYWMGQLIRKFELQHSSFSKYESSWRESHEHELVGNTLGDFLTRF